MATQIETIDRASWCMRGAPDNIFMVIDLLQEHDLPKRPLSKGTKYQAQHREFEFRRVLSEAPDDCAPARQWHSGMHRIFFSARQCLEFSYPQLSTRCHMPEVKDDGGQFASNPRGRMLTSCAPLRSNWPHPFPEFLLNFILPQHVFVYVFAHAWQADEVSAAPDRTVLFRGVSWFPCLESKSIDKN